ncbi:hypothetical protein BKE38_08425 [Pseudoroseomonas deserti]|uniref:DUF4893 domain-containing protein n=1 Tax=Teichococcus deserti TaxID=1817963 RepID=A0A1V2H4Y0_9PROT|nr:DUF4893 domain-containing protein [Pseudoroseomonas deserti]ONG55801.1 hypothetical protein BKE38_08425 [Pseudoroseomonas deserti]
MKTFFLISALASALAAAPALADGRFPNGLTPIDQARLARFETSRQAAIGIARSGGDAGDVAVLDQVLQGEATAQPPAALAGDWRCRLIKLGGILPLTLYGDFRCRITDDAAGLRIQKVSGSQRLAGTLFDTGSARLGYAGAGVAGAGQPPRYGAEQESNQVGYLVPLGPQRLRLEMPAPARESDFDILELRR